MAAQRAPSRFLTELPVEAVRWERTADDYATWSGRRDATFASERGRDATLGRGGVGARGELRVNRNPNFVGGTPKAAELASRLGIDASRLTTASELAPRATAAPAVAPGDRVNHQRYGLGRVTAVDGGKAQIDFGDQVMWVVLRNAPIEKL
jgi:DNA helicase-2/ATP-dependent DNA helicase PcrA